MVAVAFSGMRHQLLDSRVPQIWRTHINSVDGSTEASHIKFGVEVGHPAFPPDRDPQLRKALHRSSL